MTRPTPRRAGLAAAFAAGLLTLSPLALPAPAQALDTTLENVTIDNGEKGVARFSRIEVAGANLTQEELQKLFSAGLSPDERKALAAKLRADRIAIPEITLTKKDGKITVSNVLAVNINEGKIGRASVAGIDGAIPSEDGDGVVTVRSGAIALEGADLAPLASGDPSRASFSRFAAENVAMTTPDKSTPKDAAGGNLYAVQLGSLTVDASFDSGVVTRGAMSLKGLSIAPPPASDVAKQLAALGYDKILLGLDYAGVYDPAAKSFTLENLSIAGPGAGALRLKTALGGLDKNLFGGSSPERMMALFSGNVSSVEIGYTDDGLTQKVIAFFARQQGKAPAAMQAETSAMARMVVPAMLAAAPNAATIGEQVAQFLANPSTLSVGLQPKAGPIAIAELAQLHDPAAFLAKVNVEVRAGGVAAAPAPASPPAAPTAAAPPPSPPVASAAPAAPRRLSGLEAWNALVGNTVSGKNSDGDPLFEYYLRNGTVKQLDGDDVSTGKWSFKGGKVCIEYPDDDDETCYRVAVDGNIATFTDDDGTGTRYQILAGNPKRL